MNERVPDSAGLPLRAMVMVLLFLGVVFLLIGFQSIGSSNDASDTDTSAPAVATSTAPAAPATSATAPPEAAHTDVRVFNISETAGAADRTATKLKDGGWNVTETGNLTLPGVSATTVYYGTTEGEQTAAEDVAKLLEAPVEPRTPEVADQPPGVIVVVTG
jgi:LytR cell envelope-related transcriptional attenuator